MTMQGIPCIYYGSEQGLEGNGDRREFAREALWGRANAFAQDHRLYNHIKDLSALRNMYPALRYGRQYFRQCSGNDSDFGYSPFNGGVIAFSRILNSQELLVAANTNTVDPDNRFDSW
jgi:glycosidase